MESEGLLLCSQEPATGPCPKLDEFSPHSHTLLLYFKINFNIILSSSIQIF